MGAVPPLTRSPALAAGTVSVLISLGGGVAEAADTARVARVSCNAPGAGDTTVWGKCWNNDNRTGEARLVYWCKNALNNGARQHSAGWKKIKPGKTVEFVGECTSKARDPAFHVR
ncbi:hypothetical protein ACWGH8_33280 [Nonomuraea muscovyensis]